MSGVSLRSLATLAGIDKGYLSRLESGAAKNPNPDLVRALAKSLGVDVTSITYPRPECPNCTVKAAA